MKVLSFIFLTIFFASTNAIGQMPLEKNSGQADSFTIVNGSTLTFSGSNPARSKASNAQDVERVAFDLLNRKRVERGLVALQWNDELAVLARSHSQAMAREKFFSHRGKDGKMVDERADSFGLTDWRSIGENIAFIKGVAKPAELAVEKWMESTSHRNNILKNNWSDSAIGVAIAPDNTFYFTQVFLVK